MTKRNKGLNNQLEDCINEEDNMKRRNSFPAKGNEREDTPECLRSYPLSPRTRKELKDPLINPRALGYGDDEDFWEPEDNVYAESKPPDPLGKLGKTYKNGDTQTLTAEQTLFSEQDSDERTRNRNKVERGRSCRGRLKDKIRKENDSDDLEDEKELDVIKEEDDLVAAGLISDRKDKEKEEEERKRLEEELRRKIEEQDNQLLKEEKRLATNKSDGEKTEEEKSEGAHELIKKAEEEFLKSKLDSISSPGNYKDDDIDSEDLESGMKDTVPENIDGMLIPPIRTKRTFNENDIKGDVDKDEEGKKNLAVLPNGDKVDKMGRKVNDKGFLVDDKGNIIDCKTNKKMFKKNQLDENGDIPQPFKLERYNFNCHDITGA